MQLSNLEPPSRFACILQGAKLEKLRLDIKYQEAHRAAETLRDALTVLKANNSTAAHLEEDNRRLSRELEDLKRDAASAKLNSEMSDYRVNGLESVLAVNKKALDEMSSKVELLESQLEDVWTLQPWRQQVKGNPGKLSRSSRP